MHLEKRRCSREIGYRLSEGIHYLSRYDWQKFMKFEGSHTVIANQKQSASTEKRKL